MTAPEMAFSLLGPLTVRVEGAPVRVPAGKQRVLLAALLLQADRTVTADQLAELLWGRDLPPSAAVTMQNYVKRLRQTFGTGRHRIVTQPGGYLLRVHPGELDITAMEGALADAHDAARAGAWPEAARLTDVALAYWRGDPLCDITGACAFAQEASRLTELRVQARELRIEADLQLGEPARVIPEARRRVAEEPLREHTHALLMRALHESGRTAESLQAYQSARRTLVEELGCEPGPELQVLHQRILDDTCALQALPGSSRNANSSARTARPSDAVPRQLPAAVASFRGRETELSALTGLLLPGPDARVPAATVCVIGGMAGVGKTALAVRWAHQAADRFPDGQLYVNLRGFDQHDPVAAADALASFLAALSVPRQQIPDDLEDQARLYRSRLAGLRVLVVLDNARDSAQVRPLLPGDHGCAAIVTSRDQLAGLVAADGARRLDIDVLPRTEAIGLLRSLVGTQVDEEPEAAAALARLCAGLPLALRIAAELAGRPESSLAALVSELAANRLDGLDIGDDRADVRAVFSRSVRKLPRDAAAAFALFGLHPGEHLDEYAMAALSATSPAEARRVLARLRRASLLQATGPGRYGMLDLLRAYAREQACVRHTASECRQALTGLFDYYLAVAADAMDLLIPAQTQLRPRVFPNPAVQPCLSGEDGARAWLDAERANLVAVVAHCATHGWPNHATGLASTLFRYLTAGSHLPEINPAHAILEDHARFAGRHVVTIECGSNVDVDAYRRWIDH